VATRYDNLNEINRKNEFDFFTRSDLQLGSKSLKIESIGSWTVQQFYKIA